VSDESNEGRGGDGTRSTVEDLRGGVEPTKPPVGIERASTVGPDERPLLAALLSFVVPGAGHVRAGLRQRGLYLFGAWLAYLFVAAVLVVYGIGVLLILALPVVHLVVAVDGYRQVRYWRDRDPPRVG
jgi:hypothetical protein